MAAAQPRSTVLDDRSVDYWGSNEYGTVTNCYRTGAVRGTGYVGGLMGWNRGLITNGSSAGVVKADWDTGGLSGRQQRLCGPVL